MGGEYCSNAMTPWVAQTNVIDTNCYMLYVTCNFTTEMNMKWWRSEGEPMDKYVSISDFYKTTLMLTTLKLSFFSDFELKLPVSTWGY